jgi:hypothetical protein
MAAEESVSTLKRQRPAESLLHQGIEAARAGNEDLARRHLVQAVRLDAQLTDGWFWLGLMIDDPRKQLRCMRRVLYLDPTHQYAREAIEQLHEYMAGGEAAGAAEPAETAEAAEAVEEAPVVQEAANGKTAPHAPAARVDDDDDFFAVSHPQLSDDAPAARTDEDDDESLSWEWDEPVPEPADQGDSFAAAASEPETGEPTLIPWGDWSSDAETSAEWSVVSASDWGPPPELEEFDEVSSPAPEFELPPPADAPAEPYTEYAPGRAETRHPAQSGQARRRRPPGMLRAWTAAVVFNRRMAYDACRDCPRPLRTAFLMLLIITTAVFAAGVMPTLENYTLVDQNDLPRFVGESLAYALLIAGQVVFALLVASMPAALVGRQFGSRVRAGTHFGLSGLWYVPVTVLSIGLAVGVWTVTDALASSSTEIDPVVLVIGFGCAAVIFAAYLMGQMVYSSAAIHRVGITGAIMIAVVAFLVAGLILAWSLPLTLISAG